MSNTLALKDFIEQTLIEICEAVDSARTKHSYIAPKFFVDPNSPEKATLVEFDVAVTVIDSNQVLDSKGGNVKGGLSLGVVRLEANLTAEDEKTKASNISKQNRVKFSVPVFFQYDEEERKKIDSGLYDKKKSTDYDPFNS